MKSFKKENKNSTTQAIIKNTKPIFCDFGKSKTVHLSVNHLEHVRLFTIKTGIPKASFEVGQSPIYTLRIIYGCIFVFCFVHLFLLLLSFTASDSLGGHLMTRYIYNAFNLLFTFKQTVKHYSVVGAILLVT